MADAGVCRRLVTWQTHRYRAEQAHRLFGAILQRLAGAWDVPPESDVAETDPTTLGTNLRSPSTDLQITEMKINELSTGMLCRNLLPAWRRA
jgi:hypothetical protein